REVHDGGRRGHPHGHGYHLAALQGRYPQHAGQGHEGGAHPAALVPAFPDGEDGHRPPGRQGHRRHRPRLLLRLALRIGRGRQRDPGGHVQCREASAAPVLHLRTGRPRGNARRRLQGDRPLLRSGQDREVPPQDAVARRQRIGREIMAEAFANATQILEPFRGVKKVTIEEYFTSGHRTCQGCESALVMKLMVKAAGPRTIVLGATGCMYVANTTYYTTPWVVPWMHTQLGSSGSAALGTAAGLKALMKKGKMKSEPINVIAFCGDGGGADMGLGAISATLTHKEYNSLILMYDNESYANTDIQLSGSTPYGANTTFSPPGTVKRLIHTRWKKNMAGMLAAGHPECRYVATVDASYAVEMMNKVRKALSIGGPTFIHSLDPCPKGWDYDPMLSHELGELAVECGVFPLYEVEDGVVRHYGKTKAIAEGRPRQPVRTYLRHQGRFAHFTEEDLEYFQSKVDEMWDKWEIPGVIPFRRAAAGKAALEVK